MEINEQKSTVLDIQNVSISYGSEQAVRNVSMPIFEKTITAIIGPSGCGKSTLLRSLNRMNDFIENVEQSGNILLSGQDLYESGVDPVECGCASVWSFRNQILFLSLYSEMWHGVPPSMACPVILKRE